MSLTRLNGRRRQNVEEDYEIQVQKKFEENIIEKKILMRQVFNRREAYDGVEQSRQSDSSVLQFKDLFDRIQNGKHSLRRRLNELEQVCSSQSDLGDQELSLVESVQYKQQSSKSSKMMLRSRLGQPSPISPLSRSSSKKKFICALTLDELKDQLSLTENAIELENQLLESLQRIENEISQRKMVMDKKVMKLRRIQQIIITQFQDHKKIKDKYINEAQDVIEILDGSKQQIENLLVVERAYTLKVREKGQASKKAIEREEIILGHVLVRLEQAQQQNELMQAQVLEVTQQELQYRSRHKEFFYIGQYVTLFEELKRLVGSGNPDELIFKFHQMTEQSNSRVQSRSKVQSSVRTNRMDNNDSNTPNRSARIPSLKYQFKQQKTADDTQREQHLKEIYLSHQQTEFDRLEIVSRLDRFYNSNPQGLNQLVEQSAHFFNQLQLEQNSLQSTYQDKSHEKAEKKILILNLESQRDQFHTQYLKVEEVENDPQFNENFDNRKVSLDSGMIQMMRSNDDQSLTTINKILHNGTQCSHDNARIEYEFRVNESFIMNYYIYLSELLSRICYSLIWLSESTNMLPSELDSRCNGVLKRISSNRNIPIWIPSYSIPVPQKDQFEQKKNSFMNFFQKKNVMVDKKGSFIMVFGRKSKDNNNNFNNTSQTHLQYEQKKSYTRRESNEQTHSILKGPNSSGKSSKKMGSYKRNVNSIQMKQDDESVSSDFLEEDEVKKISTLINTHEMFAQRFPKYKEAQQDWKQLANSDKVSSQFIRPDQMSSILDQLQKMGDEQSIRKHIHQAYSLSVIAGFSALRETMEFIFSNYGEVLYLVNEMIKITKEDIGDFKSNKSKEQKVSNDQKLVDNLYLKECSKRIQDKMNSYQNSEDPIIKDLKNETVRSKQKLADDDQRYYMKFIEDSNRIQKSRSLLHEKLISQAIQRIDLQKSRELEQNFYLQRSGENSMTDNDFINTERKHMKHLFSKEQDEQNQTKTKSINNKQGTDALVIRFFSDINNYETNQVKSLNKSAAVFQKLSQLDHINRSTDHLNLKDDLIEQQKTLAKKINRDSLKQSHNYDRPNKIYQIRKGMHQQEQIKQQQDLLDHKNMINSSLPNISIKKQIKTSLSQDDSKRSTRNLSIKNIIGLQQKRPKSPFLDHHNIMSQHLDLSLLNLERKLKQTTFLVGEPSKDVNDYGFPLGNLGKMDESNKYKIF